MFFKTDQRANDRLFSSAMQGALAVHTFSDPDPLLEFALDFILGITNARAGSIFLWNDVSKELKLGLAKGPHWNRISGVRLKLREGVAGRVAAEGLPVLVKNIHEDHRFREEKRSPNYRSNSFISLPLLAGNKLIGVLNITERANSMPFDEDDFERANAFAKHVAIAFENLKIEKRLRKDNDELHQSVNSLREKLKQKESLASIGRLAADLSHELNNPLDAIRRFVNLALDQVMEDSLAREYLLKAKGGIRRAIGVIRGLLAFTRETNGHTVRTSDLHAVIEKIASAMAENPKFAQVQFERKLCEGTFFVQDCGLQSVFKNLFENACRAMNGSGKIIVGTYRENGHIIASVQDTGSGIPKEIQGRIFEPFFTTNDKEEGAGIGLTLCREIIARSGGAISFESHKEKGTTFLISLPLQHGLLNPS